MRDMPGDLSEDAGVQSKCGVNTLITPDHSGLQERSSG